MLVTLLRWACDPALLAGNASLILISRDAAELNPRLLASPWVRTITIPRATDQLRARFLLTLPPVALLPSELVLRHTAGLSLNAVSRALALVREKPSEAALIAACDRERAATSLAPAPAR